MQEEEDEFQLEKEDEVRASPRKDRFSRVYVEDSAEEFKCHQSEEEDSDRADEYDQEEVSDQGKRGKAPLHADDSEEEKGQKVLLDNLPQTEDEIKRMMKDVAGEIMKLEMVFFEEEESELDVAAVEEEEAKAEQ